MKSCLCLAVALLVVVPVSGAYGFSAGPETGKTELTIYDMNGQPLGTVRNSLVDAEGDIVFVILALGTEPAQDRREIIVPLRALSFHERSSVIVLKMSAEQLAAAPEFHFSDLSDPSFGERVYEFYGQYPAWKERGVNRIGNEENTAHTI
jgi:hypothetical protein